MTKDMIDKRALTNELTDAFIQYQYRLDNPMPTPNETMDIRRRKYLSDAVFQTKVDSLVAGVMRIVSRHIKD